MPEKRSDLQPFNAVLIEKGGRFYFFDPGLGTVASGGTVEQAYQKFAGLRVALAAEIEQAGLVVPAGPVRAAVAAGPGFGRELGLFAAKFCLALVILAAVGVPVAAGVARAISNGLSQAVASIQPISLADISHKAAVIARDAENLSPEYKETLRRSIAVIKRELGPAIDAWSQPPDARPTPDR